MTFTFAILTPVVQRAIEAGQLTADEASRLASVIDVRAESAIEALLIAGLVVDVEYGDNVTLVPIAAL